MKVVILAGGFGTRISEESYLKPKPMIEIGGKPILWHIMKHYSYYGFNEFIICAGYKQNIIKEWFANYYLHTSDITFDFTSDNHMTVHSNMTEPWKVTIVDTGLDTMTGGRIKRIEPYIENDTFMLTYGDGISDINLKTLLEFHKIHGHIGTISAARPKGRFGVLDIKDDQVVAFREKNKNDCGWVNCGFMVLEPQIMRYIENDNSTFEHVPLETLSADGELMVYKHQGFWQCMDTKRDKEELEALWMRDGEAPWKIW